MSTPSTPRICVFGAGNIGCYVGGRLAAARAELTLIGRERLRLELERHGLHLTDLKGADLRVRPERLRFATDADAASDAELVLVTVKSADTRLAAQSLAPVLGREAIVVSFQNGLGNADVLKERLPQQVVLTGMVPFNVVNRGQGAFHHGSEGSLDVEAHPAMAAFTRQFDAAGLPLTQHADMRPVQWAKLLLNLNNPVNALSNLPLKQELSQRAYRRCVGLAQHEALALLDAAGIRLARLTPVPPHWIPTLLSLPDWLFARLANTMLAIDPLARSSMWEDLEAGRRTEVAWLNGEVVRLARSLGRAAPVNERLLDLIRAAEAGGPREWSGSGLLAELSRASGRTRETGNAR
jgi:2-dehydropantoate 2-reductase